MICKNYGVVYIEEVAIVNFLINGALLSLSVAILKLDKSRFGIILSAIIGAVFSLFLPFVDNDVWVYKIATLIATTIFAAKFKSARKYVLFLLTFAAASFLAGGAAYSFLGFGVTHGSMLTYPARKGVKWAVIGGFAFLWVFTWEMGHFAVRRRISGLQACFCDIVVDGKSEKLKCFNDTGNRLIDGVTGKGVVILSRDAGKRYLQKTERYIDVKTVTAVKRCPVFVADALVFHTGDGRRAYEKVPVAIADTDLDGCKLIYNADALKGVI